jgi:hypothetical protein
MQLEVHILLFGIVIHSITHIVFVYRGRFRLKLLLRGACMVQFLPINAEVLDHAAQIGLTRPVSLPYLIVCDYM